jgi:2-oxoglutarate ferredoxin oxidoreductase subunit alpha
MRDKLVSQIDRFSYYDTRIEEAAETLIITYGITARAVNTAVDELKQNGNPVSLLTLKTLWPVPEQVIKANADSVKRVVVIEMNLGQYVREIQRILPGKEVRWFGQMNGKLLTPFQIVEAFKHDQFA